VLVLKGEIDISLEDKNHRYNDSLDELERRIDITRRARFTCSTRLRKYFDTIQNLIIYYNILVVILSIVTLYHFFNDKAEWITYFTLALSIGLSFFVTHIGSKNYKEKAILMETNGHDLSKIYGKIEMLRLKSEIERIKITGLYKEYERVLINVENHESIDYLQVKHNKNIATEIDNNEIKNYYLRQKRILLFAYLIPLIISIVVVTIPLLI